MAVPMSSSPKIRNMNENADEQRRAEAMKITRSTSASTIPIDEHPLLVLGGHGERGHDDHEDEEVVDRQALLDDVAGEVLAAEVPAGDRGRRRRRSAIATAM